VTDQLVKEVVNLVLDKVRWCRFHVKLASCCKSTTTTMIGCNRTCMTIDTDDQTSKQQREKE